MSALPLRSLVERKFSITIDYGPINQARYAASLVTQILLEMLSFISYNPIVFVRNQNNSENYQQLVNKNKTSNKG